MIKRFQGKIKDHNNLAVPTIDSGKVDLFPRANLGHPITIECPVGGHPFPQIKWLLNGVEVRILILDSSTNVESVISSEDIDAKNSEN